MYQFTGNNNPFSGNASAFTPNRDAFVQQGVGGFDLQGASLPSARFANLPPGFNMPNTQPGDLQQNGPQVQGGPLNPSDLIPNSPGGLTPFGGMDRPGLPGSVWGEGAGQLPTIGPGQYQQPSNDVLARFGSGSLGLPDWGVTRNANVFGSSVGHIQSPIGHAYQPSYTPYGLNPFASQADSFGLLRNSPYAGAMNAQAMGLGSYRPSQSQWFSHYPIYDQMSSNMFNRKTGLNGYSRGAVDVFDGTAGHFGQRHNPFLGMSDVQGGMPGWAQQQGRMIEEFYRDK